jgi:two-component system, NarL family, response regulator NreC
VTPAKIRILVADDHAVLRSGLRLLINGQPDMMVVAEAADGREALARARETKPDVALLDLAMPGTDAMKTIAQLVHLRPALRVVVLTMHDDPAYVDSALAAGARGFVVKRAADLELLAAIRAAAGGRLYVDATARNGTHAPRRGPGREPPAGGQLSPRERQVLRLLGEGFTHREIAARLGVGEKSVETYRARLAQKLRLHRRADLVRYALQTGLLSLDSMAEDDPGARRRRGR